MDQPRESRKRLRPWLERMIVSGECPGLVWENAEMRTFRIPWRHFNNKDWVERDSQIFMEWAKYTGKYHEGERLEYPVWKTRLRCALKKIPEIRELPDLHHLEDPDPYRVYQFVDIPTGRRVHEVDSDYSTSPGSSVSVQTNSPSSRDLLEDSMTPPPNYREDSFLERTPPANVPTVVYDDHLFNYHNQVVKQEGFVYHPYPYTDQEAMHYHFQQNYSHYNMYNNVEGGCFSQAAASSQNFLGVSSSSSSTGHSDLPALAPDSSHYVVGIPTGSEAMKVSLPEDLRSLSSSDLCSYVVDSLPSVSLTDSPATDIKSPADCTISLDILYGFPHISVDRRIVRANGCRLYFGAPQLQNTQMEEELYGPRTVDPIELPNVNKFPEICGEQKRFISELLDGMERGLVLTVKDDNIYAQRLCRIRIFLSDGATESRLLDRKEKIPIKVFDFNEYKKSIDSYLSKNAPLPKHFFYLTFGQEVKKNRTQPMGRILIHVQVIHNKALEYANRMTSSDTSQSFLPLMSSLNTYDHLLQGFRNMAVSSAN